MRLCTVGHSVRSRREFLALLRENRISRIRERGTRRGVTESGWFSHGFRNCAHNALSPGFRDTLVSIVQLAEEGRRVVIFAERLH
ncbi:MAG: hypothetical protein ACE5KH_01315 [Candidatus Geothermarchaeales archaeon]